MLHGSFRIVVEGEARILVPVKGSSPQVFYNPMMVLNRDVTVAVLAAFTGGRDFTYLDALAATGIKGIRVGVEIGGFITLCDWSLDAVELMRENIRLNDLSNCRPVHADSRVLMDTENFDVVDLDPFGTPMPFLASAGNSVRGMLSVTATDTAPLCGAHLNSAIRTYAAHPQKNEYHRETGLRVLIGATVRSLAAIGKAAIPVLSYAHRHFARTHLVIERKVKSIDDVMKKIGYMAHCNHCNNHQPVPGLAPTIEGCERCGARVTLSGPLWLGPLHERRLASEAAAEAEKRGQNDARKLLEVCASEITTPMYHDYHKITHQLKISAPPITDVIEALRERGYAASRTHLTGTGIKTDADLSTIEETIRDVTR
ncbi:MAG: tRNA (guanine(10)-N(2))-dimethyltransferase [Candidatus Syntropharchaeia archaeon]